jgi:hypothetical protein
MATRCRGPSSDCRSASVSGEPIQNDPGGISISFMPAELVSSAGAVGELAAPGGAWVLGGAGAAKNASNRLRAVALQQRDDLAFDEVAVGRGVADEDSGHGSIPAVTGPVGKAFRDALIVTSRATGREELYRQRNENGVRPRPVASAGKTKRSSYELARMPLVERARMAGLQ